MTSWTCILGRVALAVALLAAAGAARAQRFDPDGIKAAARLKARAAAPAWKPAAAPQPKLREASSKLVLTGGLSTLEGAGGGGVVPWALITGYGTRDQIGGSVHVTRIRTQNLEISSAGAAVGLMDRLELSYAEQTVRTGPRSLRIAPEGDRFQTQVFALKLRLFGDAIYDQTWVPQVSFGIQYRDVNRARLLRLLGVPDDDDVDYYLAATKFLLAERLLLNATLRSTRANQLGALGFGGPRSNTHKLQFETSIAYMIDQRTAVGFEYRMKPDNMSTKEDDWITLFATYCPTKSLSITAAYVDLGNIAILGEQTGPYFSLQTGF